MSNLKKEYTEIVVPKLVKEFQYSNIHEIPKIEKINYHLLKLDINEKRTKRKKKRKMQKEKKKMAKKYKICEKLL